MLDSRHFVVTQLVKYVVLSCKFLLQIAKRKISEYCNFLTLNHKMTVWEPNFLTKFWQTLCTSSEQEYNYHLRNIE